MFWSLALWHFKVLGRFARFRPLPAYFRPVINPEYFSVPNLMSWIFSINSRLTLTLRANIFRAFGFPEKFHNIEIKVFVQLRVFPSILFRALYYYYYYYFNTGYYSHRHMKYWLGSCTDTSREKYQLAVVESKLLADPKKIWCLMGRLIYLYHSRPKLSYSIHILSQFI